MTKYYLIEGTKILNTCVAKTHDGAEAILDPTDAQQVLSHDEYELRLKTNGYYI